MSLKRRTIIVILLLVSMLLTIFLLLAESRSVLSVIFAVVVVLILLTVTSLVFLTKSKQVVVDGSTHMKDVEGDLKAFKSIFYHLDEGFFFMNEDEVITFESAAWTRWFNKSQARLIDLKVIPKLWSSLNKVIAKEQELIFDMSFHERHYYVKATPIHVDSVYKGIAVHVKDVTVMQQIDSMQSDFLADISHEIKTPLSAILGAVDILLHRKKTLSEQDQTTFENILKNESRRLNRLIDELINLSKYRSFYTQEMIKSTFNLNQLLQPIIALYHPIAKEKNIDIILDSSCDIDIFMDEDKARQIFTNLLSNAVRYTEKGQIVFSANTTKDTVSIMIQDTGSGIPASQLDRIFDRFYRTDFSRTRVSGGTGLGLAITKAIIEAHQGQIKVLSQLHEGTTFIVTIPYIQS